MKIPAIGAALCCALPLAAEAVPLPAHELTYTFSAVVEDVEDRLADGYVHPGTAPAWGEMDRGIAMLGTLHLTISGTDADISSCTLASMDSDATYRCATDEDVLWSFDPATGALDLESRSKWDQYFFDFTEAPFGERGTLAGSMSMAIEWSDYFDVRTVRLSVEEARVEGLPPVPLPASGLLLVGGVAGLGLARSRRPA